MLERYGMTETVMNVSNPYDGERRPGTVGFPLPGVEHRASATDGEIVRARAQRVRGLLGATRGDRRGIRRDGWFRTGDVGALDDDGYLRIVGRARS